MYNLFPPHGLHLPDRVHGLLIDLYDLALVSGWKPYDVHGIYCIAFSACFLGWSRPVQMLHYVA